MSLLHLIPKGREIEKNESFPKKVLTIQEEPVVVRAPVAKAARKNRKVKV